MLKPLFRHLAHQVFSPSTLLHGKYKAFREVLRYDNLALERIADIEEIFYGEQYADWARITWLCERLTRATRDMIRAYQTMCPLQTGDLIKRHTSIAGTIQTGLIFPSPPASEPPYVLKMDASATKPQVSGGKGAVLADLALLPKIPVLPGYIVTANAFNLFMEHNGLREKMDKCLRSVRPCRTRRMQELAAFMEGEIMAGEVPPVIATELLAAAEMLMDTTGYSRLILRSSAVAEDSAVSFAGQYLSVPDVSREDILHAYKQVLAGKYSAKALFYRIFHGLSDLETSMAVVVQPMLHPRAGGVVYTRDPGQTKDVLGIYAVPGAVDGLMDGVANAQALFVSRDGGMDASLAKGSTDKCVLPQDLSSVSLGTLLDVGQAEDLVRICCTLEELKGCPQDVEWALCEDGAIVVLQSRPIDSSADPDPEVLHQETEHTPLPLDICCAASGIGVGPVHILRDWNELDSVPDQCVVMTPGLSPELVQIMPRLRGVLAKTGSRACHFASVARECGIPVLISPDMETVVRPLMEVTIDGNNGALYEGRVESLTRISRPVRPQSFFGEQRFTTIMPPIAKLTLTDPTSSAFIAGNCQSMHDIVRFVHEKAVGEMFDLVNKSGRGLSKARKLVSDLPLSLYVLDLNGGLSGSAFGGDVIPGDISCASFTALWEGLSSPDIYWDARMPHVDWEEFDRISAGIFSSDTPILSSYAVISEHYMHLMLRFGYHFSVVDCLCGDDPKNNYINFRFKGGGASFEGRVLRLEFITRILGGNGFQITSKGDILDARVARLGCSDLRPHLVILGRLLAMTRMMDMRLGSLEQIDPLIEEFYRT